MDFLKELFTEPLSFEEFQKRVTEKGFKLADLGTGDYVSKEKFEKKEGEIATLKANLKEANEKIGSFSDLDVDGMKQEVETWKTKVAEMETKQKEQEYASKISKLVEKEQFTSNAAKKQFVADLVAKKLPFQDDTLLGYSDYKEAYEKADPTAFVKDEGHVKVKIGGMGNQDNGMVAEVKAFKEMSIVQKSILKRDDPEKYKILNDMLHKK